jgi:hypothetical protein
LGSSSFCINVDQRLRDSVNQWDKNNAGLGVIAASCVGHGSGWFQKVNGSTKQTRHAPATD